MSPYEKQQSAVAYQGQLSKQFHAEGNFGTNNHEWGRATKLGPCDDHVFGSTNNH